MRTGAANDDGRRPGERSSSGFTLLELLVAMTLLGLLMTALFGGLKLGARVWEASDRVLNDESRALVIRQFLHDRLEQAFPARLGQTDGSPSVFVGDRTALRFASTMVDSLGPGPFLLELTLQPWPNRDVAHDLILRWRAIGADEGPDERVLISGLSTISFAYFGTKDEREGPTGLACDLAGSDGAAETSFGWSSDRKRTRLPAGHP